MTKYTPQQQAEIMANTRKIHHRKSSVENRMIARQMGLADDDVDADKLCQSLGLVPWGKQTILKEMMFYIDSH